MEKKELIDRLDRAYGMEETMVVMLIGLCNTDTLSAELSAGTQDRIRIILQGIRDDSIRHKKMVLEIKNGLK